MQIYQSLLGADGPLSRALPTFQPRHAQQQMAARIDEALRVRATLLVEAGTGTGKTYAYLVPALLSGLRVLISTGTRTLQDQLFHRDLPLLASALGRPARVALLKGRSNYLCRARLADMGRQAALLPARSDALVRRIRDWSEATASGDLAEISELADAHPLRAHITSTRESCLGTRCSEFARCHVFEARRAAQEADIVVVNHHLLLADLALKEDGFGDLLPSVDAVILDEAHQLPDLASEFFGLAVSSRQIELWISDAHRELRAAGAIAEEPLTRVEQIERVLAELISDVGRTERSVGLRDVAADVRAGIEDLYDGLTAAAAAVAQLALPESGQACAGRAAEFATALGTILELETDAPMAGARTLSAGARGFTLRLLPYEIATRFRALCSQGHNAWVFTSATLTVGDDFGHFAARLGLEEAQTLRLESPFDFERQALLYLPKQLPEPSDPAYGDALIETARPLIEAACGGAFLLFTSHRALRQAAERLAEQLVPELPLLVQGSAPRELLLRRFRASGHAVLLGTASFWEGVDVQGSALRLVIIDKLPFASPDDPVVRARIEHLQSQGQSPFQLYQLPEAVLALKQGVGRLIRSEHDRGVVVICDPRFASRSYGRVFHRSLPPMTLTREADLALRWLRELAQDASAAGRVALPL